MTRSTGISGLIFGGVASHPLHGGPHGRQIDDGGNPGEILQDHPRRMKGDLRGMNRSG